MRGRFHYFGCWNDWQGARERCLDREDDFAQLGRNLATRRGPIALANEILRGDGSAGSHPLSSPPADQAEAQQGEGRQGEGGGLGDDTSNRSAAAKLDFSQAAPRTAAVVII